MNPVKLAFLSCSIFALAGCKTMPVPEDIAAVITDPTQKSRAELLQVLTKALNMTPVSIAEGALTRKSVLIIERQRVRDLKNRPLRGRDLRRPKLFRLVLSGEKCILVDQSDGRRWVLSETSCVPE